VQFFNSTFSRGCLASRRFFHPDRTLGPSRSPPYVCSIGHCFVENRAVVFSFGSSRASVLRRACPLLDSSVRDSSFPFPSLMGLSSSEVGVEYLRLFITAPFFPFSIQLMPFSSGWCLFLPPARRHHDSSMQPFLLAIGTRFPNFPVISQVDSMMSRWIFCAFFLDGHLRSFFMFDHGLVPSPGRGTFLSLFPLLSRSSLVVSFEEDLCVYFRLRVWA